jgi:hypothetical protein
LKPLTVAKILVFAAACLPAAALAYKFYRYFYGGDFNALTTSRTRPGRGRSPSSRFRSASRRCDA